MDPVRGLVGGLELAETGEQPLPQRRRLLCPQKYPSRTDELLLAAKSRRRRRSCLRRRGRSQPGGYASIIGLGGSIRFHALG